MATTTYHEYTGNGSTTEFVYSFEPIKIEDVKVALNGVTQTTGYTATLSPAKVTFTSAPADGVIVRVYRDTDVDSPKAVYAAGSSIRALDLNNNHDQLLYALQEEQNQKGIYESISLDDSRSIKFGNSDDASIYWDGTGDAMGHQMMITSAGPMKLSTGSNKNIQFAPGGTVEVYISSSKIQTSVNILPDADGTLDLGSSSKEWKDLYVDGTGHIDTIESDSITATTVDINGGTIDGATIGASSASTGAFTTLTTSSNATVTGVLTAGDFQLSGAGKVASDLTPNVHANYNLGATNIRWGSAYVNTGNINDITGGSVITTGISTSDTKIYSAKRAGEIFYEKGTVDDITSGDTWVGDDNKLATTAAIDARIVDLVDDVGGFVPIANETSFPNTNPDVNNGAGTLISVPLANNLTSNGSGVISISNGTVGNSTVTINGAANSTTYTQGFGIIVETTTTLNTYNFHRYVPKATEVTAVAGSIANVNSVAGNASNINAVVSNASNINSVAGNASNINSAVSNASNINSAVSNASNINSAVSNASNITTVAGIADNVTTVSGISSDVTAVAGDAADIGTCSTNIGSIAAIGSDLANNFANITDYGAITGTVTSTSGTSDITTVANNLTNINTVAGKGTEIGRLGTADAVADMVLLATTDCIADMAILGTSDVVSDLNTLATTDVVSDMNTLATAAIVSDMDTLADISTNITTVSDNKDSVTTCASNISNINNASTHAANALAYRDAASAILTQVDSAPYNLADNVSSHTAWGEITDTGANAVFTNETSNTLLTMAEGSSNYNYGSIT